MTTPPPDELDRLLSDFFKAQLKNPWPNAPTPAARPPAEPSGRVAARTASAPAAAPRGHDGARARVTLAASVALMLGTCWYMSNGFEPGARPDGVAAPGGPGPMLRDGGASDKGVLPEVQKIKAVEGGHADPGHKAPDNGNVDPSRFE